MKAKDYYVKYGEQLMNPDTTESALSSLLMDFVLECQDVIKRRKVSSDKSALAVVDEQNNKWNALCEMFPATVLVRNGFRTYMYKQLGVTKEKADFIRGRRL